MRQAFSKTRTTGRHVVFTCIPVFLNKTFFSYKFIFLQMNNLNNQTHQREDNAEAI